MLVVDILLLPSVIAVRSFQCPTRSPFLEARGTIMKALATSVARSGWQTRWRERSRAMLNRRQAAGSDIVAATDSERFASWAYVGTVVAMALSLLVSVIVGESQAQGGGNDRAALMALYNATGGPSWNNNTNWDSAAPLDDWHGVDTDRDGRVERLALRANNLTGQIPPELGHLTNLVYLDLEHGLFQGLSNNLSGPIPPELGNLTNLEGLDLTGNDLSGPIPSELGNLVNMREFSLVGNNLSGPIPPELGNLKLIFTMQLDSNNLSGSIPPELGIDPLARHSRLLSLEGNDLSGSIPSELWNGGLGSHLHLGYNRLTGPVPGFASHQVGITSLSLNGNRLTGPLPSSITNLKHLDTLQIQDNDGLCAPADTAFQEWLAKVINFRGDKCDQVGASDDRATLTALYNATSGANWYNNTNWNSTAPLDQWHGVQTDNAGSVTHLRLQNNGLTGPIPAELASLEVVTHLWLNDNDLTGAIPSELGGLAHLGHLSLDTNGRLTGPVPPSFANLSTLWTLRLDETGLSGALPQNLTNLRNLQYLSMHGSALCAPDNDDFRTWVRSLNFFSGEFCGRPVPALPLAAFLLLGVLTVFAGVSRLASSYPGGMR